jgi:phosphate transport system permease protein
MWSGNTENNMNNHVKRSAEDTTAKVKASLKRRHATERRFKLYGLAAISTGLLLVAFLFVSIIGNGYPAFTQSYLSLQIYFDPDAIDPRNTGDPKVIGAADYSALVKKALRDKFPEVTNRREKRQLYGLVSSGADFQLRDMALQDPAIIGSTQSVWMPTSANVDSLIKGAIDINLPESDRPIKDDQIAWLDRFQETGDIETRFNTAFFTNGDSRDPELAGIRGALMGSLFTLIVTLLFSFPMGIATAIYLEEFAPRNRWSDLIEVNINNLAAVPSIVFGLLGLAVFINFFGLPRSAPLVGGLVLTLMTLPTIIIASRAALKSVPPSIREAALSMGASKLQMVSHHVLPLAMPGMLTGAIIGMAQALGETAPLLMIGMIAFIVDIPSGPLDPSTVLPVQIFLWSDLPERAFVERTAAAIIVLLGFLVVMNALAVFLRKRFERRW